jgi:DNA-binding NarL/FixJ family response regulator
VLPSPERPGRRALSPDELEVLRLLAAGLLTDEVAVALHIDPDAVRGHVSEILVALAARSKLEAVVIALRRGLVDLPADGGRGYGSGLGSTDAPEAANGT